MMSQEQAAKYFIVGWVKGWSLRVYWDTVCEKTGADWSAAHETYKWLPKDVGWFVRNVKIQRYIGDSFRSLNNKLWDAKDNSARLALSSLVQSTSGSDATQKQSDASKALSAEDKRMRASRLGYKLTVDAMRKSNGSAWNVCK